jgi:hypothetical protein
MKLNISASNLRRIKIAAAIHEQTPEQYVNKVLDDYLSDVFDLGRIEEMEVGNRDYADGAQQERVRANALRHDLKAWRRQRLPEELCAAYLAESLYPAEVLELMREVA